jgi:hypothetical protein
MEFLAAALENPTILVNLGGDSVKSDLALVEQFVMLADNLSGVHSSLKVAVAGGDSTGGGLLDNMLCVFDQITAAMEEGKDMQSSAGKDMKQFFDDLKRSIKQQMNDSKPDVLAACMERLKIMKTRVLMRLAALGFFAKLLRKSRWRSSICRPRAFATGITLMSELLGSLSLLPLASMPEVPEQFLSPSFADWECTWLTCRS